VNASALWIYKRDRPDEGREAYISRLPRQTKVKRRRPVRAALWEGLLGDQKRSGPNWIEPAPWPTLVLANQAVIAAKSPGTSVVEML